jgi:uroporphyrinogen-III decarboxylase
MPLRKAVQEKVRSGREVQKNVLNNRAGLPPNWSQMTPEQRREYRLKKFANPENVRFVSPEAEKAFKIRAQRFVDVYNIKEPDRVPIQMPLGNLPYIYGGINMNTAMYDYEKAVQACKKFNDRYSAELEVFVGPNATPGKALEILDYKLYAWPGHGLSIEAPGFQFVESEYMLAEEYDALIRDPSDFWLRTYLPRVFGAYECFRKFAPLTDIIEMPTVNIMPLADPQVQESLQRMLDAGKELHRRTQITGEYARLGSASGFPASMGAFCKAPFDTLGDTLRGTQGIMMDMYRRPAKLLEAMDVIADITIASVLNHSNISNMHIVSFPLHKGADGWMSQKQFETFYWPTLKKIMEALIDDGLIVLLFAEGCFDSRLETVNVFPKGSLTWWFDQTDMFRAKKILGEKCSMQGNVPSSLIATGTPGAVKEYCRKLIEVCGKGGGYTLSAGCVPDHPKLENIQAMLAATKEYGVYRK